MEASNVKAMREALESIYMDAQFICDYADEPGVVRNRANRIERTVNSALSASPRNCDVFKSEDEAKSAFIAYYNETFGLNGSIDEIGACDLKHNVDGICHDYIQWLFAPATALEAEKGGAA